MQLPVLGSSGVQSLGTTPVGQANQLAGVFSGAVDTVKKEVRLWVEAESAAETANADSLYMQDLNSLERTLESTTFFRKDELPEGVKYKTILADADGDMVPAHEVQDQLMLLETKKLREKYSGDLNYDMSKRAFNAGVTKAEQAAMHKIGLDTIDKNHTWINAQMTRSVANVVKNTTRETRETDVGKVASLIEGAILRGAVEFDDGEKLIREAAADIDFMIATKAIYQGVEDMDPDAIESELAKILEPAVMINGKLVGGTLMDGDQQIRIMKAAQDGLDDIRDKHQENKENAQDQNEVQGTVDIIAGAGPTYQDIADAQKAGTLSKQGAKALIAQRQSAEKAQSESGMVSDPGTMQAIRYDLFRLANFPNAGVPLQEQIYGFQEKLLGYRGIDGMMEGGSTGPSLISDAHYKGFKAEAEKILAAPKKSVAWQETVRSMKVLITGVPEGSLYTPDKEQSKQGVKFNLAMESLQIAASRDPNFDPKAWWARNIGVYIGDATVKALNEINDAKMRNSLVMKEGPEPVAGTKGNILRNKVDMTSVIDVPASIAVLQQQYMDGTIKTKSDLVDAINRLSAYNDQLLEAQGELD